MSLSRSNDPYGMSLRNAMDQLFAQSFVNPSMFMGQQATIAPMNVYETNNGYEVQVALAGVKPEDIDLTVQQNTLDIKGKFSYTSPQTSQGQQDSNTVESLPSQSSQSSSTSQSGQSSQSSTASQSSQSSSTSQAQGQQTQQGQSQTQSQGQYNTLLQEMTSGSFERTITFPRAIDANKIHTNFENGILTIWVPVSEASRARKISVNSTQSSQSSQSSSTSQSGQSSQPHHVSVNQG
jgi:HSP20 family molecular chaperone IbpA